MSGEFDHDMGVAMLTEVDADGFISIQIDAYGEQDSGVAAYEAHAPLGYYARPLDPTKDENGEPKPEESCTVLYALEGGRGHAWAQGDPRLTKKLPKLRKGGTMWGCPASGGYALWEGLDPAKTSPKREGTFILAAKYGAKAHSISLNVREDGKEFIRIQHGDGATIDMLPSGSVTIKSKSGAYVEVGETITVNGDVHVQGNMSAGEAAGAQPLTLAPPLVTVLTKLFAMLAVTPAVPTGSPLLPAAQALTSELSALLAQCAKSS